jgi:hypothetical protein
MKASQQQLGGGVTREYEGEVDDFPLDIFCDAQRIATEQLRVPL